MGHINLDTTLDDAYDIIKDTIAMSDCDTCPVLYQCEDSIPPDDNMDCAKIYKIYDLILKWQEG